MVRRAPTSLISALGLPAELDRLYPQLLALTGGDLRTVASFLQRDADQLAADIEPLRRHGIIDLVAGRMIVRSPTEAISILLAQQAEVAAQVRDRLDDLSAAAGFLTAAASRPGPSDVDDTRPLDGEQTRGGDPLSLLTALISQSTGDLNWLRPDAWRIPRESAVARVVGSAIANGRRSRAIYPVRALSEAPDALKARADAGEQVRVISDLETRMIVIGTTHAVLPEPLGARDSPRVLIRQPSVVGALRMLFELLWEKAEPVADLDQNGPRTSMRRHLLEQLAQGAKDEQIARSLGLSLRTVRRRIAEIQIELGVDTRFQAGAEAVRRGWL
jgi:DNA-binding CsgD family transcriptional regulator